MTAKGEPMANSQLFQFLKDNGYTRREAAAKIGFSYQYLVELLNGTTVMTDSARVKIVRAFPETAEWLLQLDLPLPETPK